LIVVPTFFLFLMAALLTGSIGLVDPALSGQNTGLDPIHFSQDSVVTRQPFRLTLTSEADGTIRYTTNGALPTADSPVYADQISIEQPTVIRARLFDDAGQPVGDVSTNSYIIVDYRQIIPLISIVTDWAHFYRLHDYPLEHGDNGERPITVEYFGPGGQSQFKVEARIQIDESDPNLLSLKKSYRLNFQPNGLEYRLFTDSPLTTVNTLLLRAAFTGEFPYHDVRIGQAQPCLIESMGDQVIRNLYQEMGRPAPHGQWVLLYLNGKYWGLYNLMEAQNFHAHAGQNPAGQHRFLSLACEFLGVATLCGQSAPEAGQLSQAQVQAEILRQAAIVRPFVPLEADRWASSLSLARFDQQIQAALTLVDER
jgi:hypothetical protein